MSKLKKTEERKDYHHLGSVDFCEPFYSKDNCEFSIEMLANKSHTHFLGEHIQPGDTLNLGLTQEAAELLCEQLMSAIAGRLKEKLEMYNSYRKVYYTSELEGTEEEFETSNWNIFKSK